MAYKNCKWCGGRGCITCPIEEENDRKKKLEPIFVGDPNNPDDMALLATIIGREAIEFAFDTDATPLDAAITGRGGGTKTIEQRAAVASLVQKLGKEKEAIRSFAQKLREEDADQEKGNKDAS